MVTTIASKGSANVPSGGLVAIAMVLSAIGLPIEALAVIAGVDAFLDMGPHRDQRVRQHGCGEAGRAVCRRRRGG